MFVRRKLGNLAPRVGVSVALIMLPSVLYMASPAIYFLNQKNPWPLAFSLFFFGTSLFTLAATVYSDPGIIPRNIETKQKPRFRTQEVMTQGQICALRFCSVCSIYRPPRAAHCYVCDKCVEVFDHHCPWEGNCIGRRNYLKFLIFLLAVISHSFFLLGIGVYHIFHFAEIIRASSAWVALAAFLGEHAVSFVVTVFAGIVFGFVMSLCGFHMFLITKGLTTSEQLKATYPNGSPHTKGTCGNLSSLCGADDDISPAGQETKKIKLVDSEELRTIATTAPPVTDDDAIAVTTTTTTTTEAQSVELAKVG